MQNFNLDISQPRGPLVLYASQGDSLSRFFAVTVTDNGAAYEAPSGAIYTVRFGAPGMPAGWYDTITEVGGATRPAVVANENTFTVEIAEQAVGKPGKNKLVLIISDAVGYTLATWDFELQVAAVPGYDAPEATVYYNALTEQVAQALANAQAAAASAAQAQQYAESINPSNFATAAQGKKADSAVQTVNGVAPASGNVDVTSIAAIQKLIAPIGYIFAWNAVDGGPDLSTAEKVATYFGFGTWASYGAGRVLTGLDPDTPQFTPAGKTSGQIEHTLTEDELPVISPQLLYAVNRAPVTLDVGDTPGYQLHFSYGNVSANNLISTFGGGQPHTNLQPYVVVYYWQRIA